MSFFGFGFGSGSSRVSLVSRALFAFIALPDGRVVSRRLLRNEEADASLAS